MARPTRRLPRNAKPARRPLSSGGTAEGYLQYGRFHPFDPTLNAMLFSGAAYEDNTVDCQPADTGSSGGYEAPSSYEPPASFDTGSYSSGSDSSSYSSDSCY